MKSDNMHNTELNERIPETEYLSNDEILTAQKRALEEIENIDPDELLDIAKRAIIDRSFLRAVVDHQTVIIQKRG